MRKEAASSSETEMDTRHDEAGLVALSVLRNDRDDRDDHAGRHHCCIRCRLNGSAIISQRLSRPSAGLLARDIMPSE